MKPTTTDINSLAESPFLSIHWMDLPDYIAAAEDIDGELDPMEFWRSHRDTLHSWAAAAFKVVLVQPYAPSERVFSLLKQSFGDNNIMHYKITLYHL